MIDQSKRVSSGKSLVVHEIIGGNLARLDDLVRLFVELFPQYAHTSGRLREKARRAAKENPRFIDHQWLVDVGGQAAGMLSFKYALQRNLGLTVYIGIRPAYRHVRVEGVRMSEWLVGRGLQQLQIDAQAANYEEPPIGLFLEVQYPRLVARYREFGFAELPVVYHEPHFLQARVGDSEVPASSHIDFRRVHLGGFPFHPERFDPSDQAMLTNVVLAFMQDHYRFSESHWAIKLALRSIGPLFSPKNEFA